MKNEEFQILTAQICMSSWGLKRPEEEPVALLQRKTDGSPGFAAGAVEGSPRRSDVPLGKQNLHPEYPLHSPGLSFRPTEGSGEISFSYNYEFLIMN